MKQHQSLCHQIYGTSHAVTTYAVGTEPQKIILELLFYPNMSGVHTIVSSPLTSPEAFSIKAKAVSMNRAKEFPPMIAVCNYGWWTECRKDLGAFILYQSQQEVTLPSCFGGGGVSVINLLEISIHWLLRKQVNSFGMGQQCLCINNPINHNNLNI